MKLKLLIYLLLVSVWNQSVAQNNIIEGRVRLQNSGSKGLNNVAIGSLDGPTITSRNDGTFELKFDGLKAGESVGEIWVTLEGYRWINEDRNQKLVIPNNPREARLDIVMAKESAFIANKLQYYGFMEEDISKRCNRLRSTETLKKKALVAQIDSLSLLIGDFESNKQKLSEERDSLITQLQLSEDKIRNLDRERLKLLDEADAFSYYLASINKDDISEKDKQALALVEEGKIEEASNLFSKEELLSAWKKAKEMEATAIENLDNAKRQVSRSLDRIIFNAKLKKNQGHVEEAKSLFEAILDEDSTNTETLAELAGIYSDGLDAKRAIKAYQQILSQNIGSVDRIRTLLDLAEILGSTSQYEAAASKVKLAISEYYNSPEAKGKFELYELAGFYLDQGNYLIKGRKSNFNKAVKILEGVPDHLRTEDYWVTYAEYYSYSGRDQLDLGNVLEARKYFQEYIRIYENLVKKDSVKHLPKLASGFNSLALSYPFSSRGHYDNLENSLNTLTLVDDLSSEYCQHCNAIIKQNLSIVAMAIGDYEKAFQLITSSILELKKLSSIHKAYLTDLAAAKFVLGDFHLKTYAFTKAKEQYEQAVNDYESYDEIQRQNGFSTRYVYDYSSDISMRVKNLEYKALRTLSIYENVPGFSSFSLDWFTPSTLRGSGVVDDFMSKEFKPTDPAKRIKKQFKGGQTVYFSLPSLSRYPTHQTKSSLEAAINMKMRNYECAKLFFPYTLSIIKDDFSRSFHLYDYGLTLQKLGDTKGHKKQLSYALQSVETVLSSQQLIKPELEMDLWLLKARITSDLLASSENTDFLDFIDNQVITKIDNPDTKNYYLAIAHTEKARLYKKKNKSGEAVEAYKRAIKGLNSLIETKKHTGQYIMDLVGVTRELSCAYHDNNQSDLSLSTLMEADKLIDDLIKRYGEEFGIYQLEKFENELARATILKSIHQLSSDPTLKQQGLIATETAVNIWESIKVETWYDATYNLPKELIELQVYFTQD